MPSKVSLVKHLSKQDLEKAYETEKDSRVKERLYAILLLYEGKKVPDAASLVRRGISTIELWIRIWNQQGVGGLKTHFAGGPKPKLSKIEWDRIVEEIENKGMTIRDVAIYVNKTRRVNYTYKAVWRILRKERHLSYRKPHKANEKRPEDTEEISKKAMVNRAARESSPTLPEPVFVGRERELEELQRHLNSACEGKGSVVLVSGEAGAGKTRLLNEFVSAAKKKKEATLLTGRCVSNAADPYFPFIEAFNGYSKSSEESSHSQSKQQATQMGLNTSEHFDNDKYEVTAWLVNQNRSERSSIPEGLSPQVRKDLTFAVVTKSLVSLSEEKPVVLFIDDLHWADSASLSLLHYLARAVNSQRILVLAAFRSEELTADIEGRPHFLVEILRVLNREGLLKEIKLAGLNKSEISEIAENMLGGIVDPELVERLTVESQGNPFFVVESLRMLLKDRELYQEEGEWRLSVDTLGVPKKVKEIILRRLNVLNRNQRRTLNAASVIGEKFDAGLLAATLRQGSIDVLETLQVVSQSTALVCCEEGFFKFAHAMHREVIYEEIPEALRKGYHAEIAEIIERNSAGSKLFLSDIAYHYREAENKKRALKYALAAGQDAVIRFSNTEAVKHFTYVLRVVGEDKDFLVQRLSALEGLGDALSGNGMVNEAMGTFLALSSISSGVVRLRALRKALEASSFLGGTPSLTELVDRAEECSGADKLEYARVLRVRAQISLVRRFMPEVALKEAEEALQVFEDEASLPDLAYVLITLGATYGSLGQIENGIAAILRSLALLRELEDSRGQAEAHIIAGEYCFAGLANEMLAMFVAASKICDKIADTYRLAYSYSDLGWANEYAGKVSEALPLTLKALSFAGKTDSNLVKGMIFGSLVRQYTFLGDDELAEAYFKRMVALPEEVLSNMIIGDFSKAVYFAGRGRWDESTE